MAGPTAPADEQLRAIHIYMGGIGLQQLFIAIFVVFAFKFQVEMHTLGDTERESRASWRSGCAPFGSWRPLLFVLYVSLTCITVRARTIVRWLSR